MSITGTCYHCGIKIQDYFRSIIRICIDDKNTYYLCAKCNKEWEDHRNLNLFGVFNDYREGICPYRDYQNAFNQLMKKWLVSSPEKVLLT